LAVGERHNESKRTISNYIRLNYLISELLKLVDEEKLNFVYGVELSHLNEENQKALLDKYISKGVKLDKAQVSELKYLSKADSLNNETMADVMVKEKVQKPPTVYKISKKDLSEFSDIIDSEEKFQAVFIEFLQSLRNQKPN